jgi:hypothetical protein
MAPTVTVTAAAPGDDWAWETAVDTVQARLEERLGVAAGRNDQRTTSTPIDEYLATLDEPKRTTLASVRDTIMAILPEAERYISYGMPAFKLRGKTIAGFAAFKNHLSYLPHSGSVIPQLAKERVRQIDRPR